MCEFAHDFTSIISPLICVSSSNLKIALLATRICVTIAPICAIFQRHSSKSITYISVIQCTFQDSTSSDRL